MRAIIRFSVDNEANSKLRNKLTKMLEDVGILRNPGVTGTYEGIIAPEQLAQMMQGFWAQVSESNEAHLDHVWIYCDNPPE